MDINAAIDAYSHAGGNQMESLLALCAGNWLVADALAAEISNSQEGIMESVRSHAGADGLPQAEIEQLARQYLAEARPHVNEVGFDGLLRYVIWLA